MIVLALFCIAGRNSDEIEANVNWCHSTMAYAEYIRPFKHQRLLLPRGQLTYHRNPHMVREPAHHLLKLIEGDSLGKNYISFWKHSRDEYGCSMCDFCMVSVMTEAGSQLEYDNFFTDEERRFLVEAVAAGTVVVGLINIEKEVGESQCHSVGYVLISSTLILLESWDTFSTERDNPLKVKGLTESDYIECIKDMFADVGVTVKNVRRPGMNYDLQRCDEMIASEDGKCLMWASLLVSRVVKLNLKKNLYKNILQLYKKLDAMLDTPDGFQRLFLEYYI